MPIYPLQAEEAAEVVAGDLRLQLFGEIRPRQQFLLRSLAGLQPESLESPASQGR
jgi:hypothetical protein